MEFRRCYIVGRFQPLHAGHCDLIDVAREIAPTTLLIGSSFGGPRNPFTFESRRELIHSYYPDVACEELPDSPGDDKAWGNLVTEIVTRSKGVLVQHTKDGEDWMHLINAPVLKIPAKRKLDATDIRQAITEGKWISGMLHGPETYLKLLKEQSK